MLVVVHKCALVLKLYEVTHFSSSGVIYALHSIHPMMLSCHDTAGDTAGIKSVSFHANYVMDFRCGGYYNEYIGLGWEGGWSDRRYPK